MALRSRARKREVGRDAPVKRNREKEGEREVMGRYEKAREIELEKYKDPGMPTKDGEDSAVGEREREKLERLSKYSLAYVYFFYYEPAFGTLYKHLVK